MKLTPELVARFPRPGMAVPGKVAYAPDGRSVTFLFSERGDLQRDLWSLDLQTGVRARLPSPPAEPVTDANVSRAEALRRERQRLRETGITEYAWAEKAMVLLVPTRGTLFRFSGGRWERLTDGAVEPQISRDGERVFFVRDGEVWCWDQAGERCLTTGAGLGITHGLAEYIAQEELDRSTGYWVSRDQRSLAFAEVDERHVPGYPIVHQGRAEVEVEEHRYPFAGAANARVRLGVVAVAGGAPVEWLDLGSEDVYLARAAWHPDQRLFVQVLARDQRRLELRAYPPGGGQGKVLLVEESDLWVNLHQDLRFVEGTGEFIWASERDGFKHLYLYAGDGRLVRRLTAGDWPVGATVALDEPRRQLYFTAAVKTPVERHLYRVALDGGAPARLTHDSGIHQAVMAPDCSSFVDIHDSRSSPPSYTIRALDGAVLHVLHAPASIDLDLVQPSLHTFQTTDGARLHAAVYRAPAATRAPIIVAVYGGPHAQIVVDSWALTVDLRAQALAMQGFVVLKVDNRGSAGRGLAFEGAIAGRLGDLEIRDQVEGVRWLAGLGFADPARVGIYGWSYGGYLTAMALVKAADVFKVGVAGAPVTSWDGYDTAYTERYLRTPATNPDGYRESAIMTHAANLAGRLLLVHGMLDENVHFRHTARLMNALIAANRPYDLLIYPNERHMPRSERDRVAMETRILEYFQRHL
jgi:dipeptidyl-peptidase-4